MSKEENQVKKFQIEYIGKKAWVKNHNREFEGKIIDETKNTLTLHTAEGEKKIIKNQATIKIGNQIIDGRKIMKRPEERIKIK